MSRFVVGELAVKDINGIWDFVARDSEFAADHIVERLFDAFAFLATHPNVGQNRFELDDMPLLFWLVKPYYVAYRDKSSLIEIVSVLHAARDIPKEIHDRHNKGLIHEP